ncbi:MAG: hypothetical protein HY754_04930 [Nitrospirae bacterium]|nr:hypothetical protein [Nitrospirota bacterium]
MGKKCKEAVGFAHGLNIEYLTIRISPRYINKNGEEGVFEANKKLA